MAVPIDAQLISFFDVCYIEKLQALIRRLSIHLLNVKLHCPFY